MNTRALALAAIGTQIVLGLILVAILFTMQGQNTPKTYPCYRDDGKGGFAYSPACDGTRLR